MQENRNAVSGKEEYLGDGVYASFDGFHIILDTRAQFPVSTIYLDPQVFDNLLQFRGSIVAEANHEEG